MVVYYFGEKAVWEISGRTLHGVAESATVPIFLSVMNDIKLTVLYNNVCRGQMVWLYRRHTVLFDGVGCITTFVCVRVFYSGTILVLACIPPFFSALSLRDICLMVYFLNTYQLNPNLILFLFCRIFSYWKNYCIFIFFLSSFYFIIIFGFSISNLPRNLSSLALLLNYVTLECLIIS